MKIAFIIHQIQYSIPLGIAYCAAVLKERGFDCQVFEIGKNYSLIKREIMDYHPAAIGFSVYSGSHQPLISLCRELKQDLDFISIFGGPHATFFPEIINIPCVDAVCRGEGELSLGDFMERYRKDGVIPTDIPNFTVRKGDDIIENPVRPLLADLDTLPYPDRMLFLKKYPVFNLHGIKHFVAHRGCPYQCTYCFNHAYNDIYGVKGLNCYHGRGPENICDEIEYEQGRMRLDMVSFVDDCFTMDKAWTLNFCDVYRRRVNLPFQINTRVENLDTDRIQALASANCWLIHIGVESGNEDYRKRVMKRMMTNDFLVATIKECRAAGIRVLTENMLGLPTETYEMALDTLKVNIAASPDYAAASFFTPYPRLELTRFAVEHGVYTEEIDDLPADYIYSTMLRFDSLSEKNRIINLRSFFNLGIQKPYLWPMLNALTRLPPNPIFRMVGDLQDGYYLWKLLPYPIRPGNLIKLIWKYIASYRKLLIKGISA